MLSEFIYNLDSFVRIIGNNFLSRVRDLSSGDTGAAAPPNTPPPRKYKLAEFRYGREEMLALVSDDYEMPLGLKEFQDIINERPVPPLAFIPLSDEEEVNIQFN